MNPTTSKTRLPGWLKVPLLGLAALLSLLLVLLMTAIAVLRNSPAQLEFVLEKVASRVLQRELEIGSVVEAELNLDSYLLVNDVTLSNPEWADSPDFARVGRLLVRINLPSIWRSGPIIIHELALSDVSLVLLAPEEHPPNWDFWPENNEQETPPDEGDSPGVREPVFPVLFSDARISNGQLSYRDADQDIVYSIEKLVIDEPAGGALINLDHTGVINDLPLVAKGSIGPFSALLTGRGLSLDLLVILGKLTVEGRGTIADLVDLSGTDLHLEVAAPRSRPLLDLLGMPEVRDGPLRLEGHITDANPGVAISAVGALEDFELRISGTLDDPMALDGVDIDFDFGGPSLAEVGAMFELPGLAEVSYEVSGRLIRQGTMFSLSNGLLKAGPGRLNLDARLPEFPGIDNWELKLEGGSFNLALLGPLIGVHDLPSIPYDIKGNLESSEEGVELLNLSIESPDSSLLLNGVVGDAPDYLESHIRLKLSGHNLASTGLWLGFHDLPSLPFQLSGELLRANSQWQLRHGIFNTPGLQFGIDGEVDSLPEPGQLDARMKLDSLNLAETLKIYGFEVEGLPAYPISVNSQLSGRPDQLRIDQAAVKSGASSLLVSGILGDPASLASLDLAVEFTTPDVLALLPAVTEGPLPPLPVDTIAAVAITAEAYLLKGVTGHVGGAPLTLDGSIGMQAPDDNSHISLSFQGSNLASVLGPWLEQDIPETPFNLALEAQIQSGGIHVQRLEATVSDAQLKAKFDIDNLEDPSSAHGTIALVGTSSQKLAQLLNAETAIPDSDYALNVVVQKTPDSLRLDPVTLDWGKSDYAGSVDIRPGDVPIVHADFHSRYVSLPFLMPNLEEREGEEASRAAAGDTGEASELTEKLTTRELAERRISSEPLDFSWLKEFQGSFKYQLDKMYIREDATGTAQVDIAIRDGVLSSRKLHWDGTFSQGDAQLTVKALNKGAEVDAYLDLQRVPLLFLLGGRPEPQPGSFYRARINARGNSFQELAKTANGAVVFQGGGGRLDNKGLDLILGDALEEILNRLNPFAKTDPYTQVDCHALAMSIRDGKVELAPGLVIRTDKMDIASGGTINLHREKLDLVFNTRSRKGLGISASKAITPYFKIGGTLANPRLALDVKGVAVSGGAAVATAGLSILAEGLWDRWVATAKNPCENLINSLSKKDRAMYSLLKQND